MQVFNKGIENIKTHDNFSTLILTTKTTVCTCYNKVLLPVVILKIESVEVQKPFLKQNINIPRRN